MDFRLFEAQRLQARPFLRWAGGKGAFLIRYGSLIPRFSGAYIEPFVGSASVFFYVQMREDRPIKARLGDVNLQLMNTLLAVRNDASGVSAALADIVRGYVSATSRTEFYNQVRARFNAALPRPEPADFIFLNRTCWNGLYRVNRAGQFNVPHGSHRGDALFPTREELACASAGLQQASLRATTWQNLVGSARAGDFLFLDPPYYSDLEQTAKYDRNGFSEADHRELGQALRRLKAARIDFMLTNSADPDLERMYCDLGLAVHRTTVPRSINSITTERQAAEELIVTPEPLPGLRLAH